MDVHDGLFIITSMPIFPILMLHYDDIITQNIIFIRIIGTRHMLPIEHPDYY